ncbi:DUF7302 family protein [Nocardia sp. IFM 10818]
MATVRNLLNHTLAEVDDDLADRLIAAGQWATHSPETRPAARRRTPAKTEE